MRIFWAVVLLLVVGTAGFIVASAAGNGKAANPSGARLASSDAETAPERARAAESAPPPRAAEVASEAAVPPGVPAATTVPPAAPVVSAEPQAAPADGPAGLVPGTSEVVVPEAAAPVPVVVEPASETPDVPLAMPDATGTEDDAEVAVPNAAIDPTATRAAAGMLANLINQSLLAPESDFIGRLAEAGNWQPAPEVLAAFPEASRAFQVPVGSSLLFVADNGAGGGVTIIIPRGDLGLIHALLAQTLRLEPTSSVPVPEGRQELNVSLADVPAGVLTIRPAPGSFGPSALAVEFDAVIGLVDAEHATEPVIPEPGVPAAPSEPDAGLRTNGDTGVLDPLVVPEAPTVDPELALEAPSEAPPPGVAAVPAYTILQDGSIQLDSGTIIRGQGTAEKPYEITWELLVSAERVYQPRNGLTSLPGWCRALNEKHVRLTGHLLSPLMMDDTDQILLMRNQWDGCCIGVPPSPYDAVEVTLSRPISLVREQLNYGTLSGVFEVDPYVVNNWLVGLYILSEAKAEAANAQNWAVPTGAPN